MTQQQQRRRRCLPGVAVAFSRNVLGPRNHRSQGSRLWTVLQF